MNTENKRDAQWAKIPFLPLLEKEAERFVLYGVLSLLNRTWVKRDEHPGFGKSEFAHVAVDAVDHVLRRQGWNLRVGLDDPVRERVNKCLPLLLSLPIHGL